MSTGSRRSETVCPLFGPYSELDPKQLPTISDVVKFILLKRHELKQKYNGKQPSNSEIFLLVNKEIECIWKNASIPIVSQERVKQLLKLHFDKYLSFIRYPNSKKNENFNQKINNFVTYCSKTLFDIASCKCEKKCTCSKQRKVPLKEIDFLIDQRGERKMIIGSIDRAETIKLQNKELRTVQSLNYEEKNSLGPSMSGVTRRVLYRDSSDISVTAPDTVSMPSTSQNNYNQLSLPTVATVCDRFGLSSRSAAAITSAVLVDIGIVTETNRRLVVDKNKIRRAVSKSRKEMQDISGNEILRSLYFDGRKDKTLISEKKGNRLHRKEIMEEHVSILAEPGSHYVGHVTPKKGTGIEIAKAIIDFLRSKEYNMVDIECIGCDGTATNTGWKGGVVQYIEKHLKRPLQWAVCLLHANELPLRHLFTALDGSTSGPREFSGPIGKNLVACEKNEVVAYFPVSGNMPHIEDEVIKDLSTDQKYLFEICHSVASGFCSQYLANRQPGKIAHSRWLTFANSILRLYISTSDPSENLKNIVNYIMKVYAPVWFFIKAQPTLKDGAHHFYKLIKFSRDLPEEVRAVIDPVIQRNAFFGHPENLLLAMLYDSRDHVRQLAVARIMKARLSGSTTQIRIFKPPKINFLAENYIDMLLWQDLVITPPPIVSKYSDEELQDMAKNNQMIQYDYPCHTQGVERTVKLVTEASHRVIGETARDGLIKNMLKSRSE